MVGGAQRCHRVIKQSAGLGHHEEFLFSARTKWRFFEIKGVNALICP
jgi:hypothetical protein